MSPEATGWWCEHASNHPARFARTPPFQGGDDSLSHALSLRQQEHPRAAVHAARGCFASAFPHLSARSRHLARLHRRQNRPYRPLDRNRELPVPHRRQRRAAFAVQHAFLHDRGERAQVCPRVVAGADSQPPPPVQVVHPGDRAAAVHRADGALRNRVLVDLRFPVLGRELDAREDGPDRPLHRFPGRALARAALGDRGEHLAGRPGSSSGTSRCRCSRRSSPW